MMIHTYLIIGASRGLGHELVSQLSADPSNHIIATVRKPVDFSQKNVETLILDQNDSASVAKAATNVKAVDTIVLNGAIGDTEQILTTSTKRLQEYLNTNVVGIHRTVEAFLPALRAGKAKKIIIVSSAMGSMQVKKDMAFGLTGPYSITKAANNMQAVQYHNSLKDDGFTVIALHPGWIATDMGDRMGKGGLPVATAASNVIKVIGGLTQADSGKFFSHDGTNLPW